MITIEDFYEMLWEEIPSSVIPDSFLSNNQDCVDSITYDLYRMYCMTKKGIDIKQMARMLESFYINCKIHSLF